MACRSRERLNVPVNWAANPKHTPHCLNGPLAAIMLNACTFSMDSLALSLLSKCIWLILCTKKTLNKREKGKQSATAFEFAGTTNTPPC